VFAHIQVDGREHLRTLRGPVIFAANHQSHFDVPVILASLPGRLRARVRPRWPRSSSRPLLPGRLLAPRAAVELAQLLPGRLLLQRLPAPQREAGARQTLQYIGELSGKGWSILIFPEGARSPSGEIKEFRGGIGMIGARLDVPVVPVRLDGIDRILPTGSSFARMAKVRVAFGAPLTLRGDDYSALAKQVEDAVRAL
jgi:long-chain acyl-CoA synthetase